MLEEDPAKITVHLVQLEKYVPFCMPGAEGTFVNAFVVTWLRTGSRMFMAAPFGRGRVACVHHRRGCALGVCAVGVVSLRFSCDVCQQRSGRVYLCASSSPGVVGADEEKADSPSLPQMNKGQSGLVLVRVVVLIIPILCPCPRPSHTHTAPRGRQCVSSLLTLPTTRHTGLF